MTENVEKLVRMANQIADFFGPYPEKEAVSGIKEHLKSFWTPAMRDELFQHADAGGAGLRPRVMLAIQQARGGGTPVGKAAAG